MRSFLNYNCSRYKFTNTQDSFFYFLLEPYVRDVFEVFKVFDMSFYSIDIVQLIENKNNSALYTHFEWSKANQLEMQRWAAEFVFNWDAITRRNLHALVITLHLVLMKMNPSFVIIPSKITILPSVLRWIASKTRNIVPLKKIVININKTKCSGNNDWSHHMTRVTPSLASHLHIAWFPAAMASWRVDELENTSSSRTSNGLSVYKSG